MNNSDCIEYAAQTDKGLARTHNEDAIVLCPEHDLTILADGMGGYNAGEVASQTAISVIKGYIGTNFNGFLSRPIPYHAGELLQIVSESVELANHVVLNAAQNDPRYLGMGTTLVMSLCYRDMLVVAHVGDSRAYRYRNSEFEQITRDHSVVQERLDAGTLSADSAQYSRLKNLVTRAVGVGVPVKAEVNLYQIQPGDMYLLCSDGLTDMLTAHQIEALMDNKVLSLQEICGALIEQANLAGGRDNISVILFRINQIKSAGLKQIF